jgi:N-acetylglucosamine kinase-like BadF-type ATPase
MTRVPLYVGIDAGGTGTRAAVAAADGTLLAVSEGGPSGTVGGAEGQRLLRSRLAWVLEPLESETRSRPCVVHLGMRGLSIADRRAAAIAELKQRLPQARVEVSSDAAIALSGGLAGRAGVAVLAGTGSIAFATRADGSEVRSGGLGYLVGDEGGGYWLGREAIAASLRSLDGRGPRTLLGDRLRRTLGLASVSDLVGWLYQGSDQVPRVARLAPQVARAAAEGDAVAREVVERAAGFLVELAVSAAQRAWPEALTDPLPEPLFVARCGGVWSMGPLLVEPFDRALVARLPTARSVPPRLPPVGGAILLAMATDGNSAADAVIDRLAAAFAARAPGL